MIQKTNRLLRTGKKEKNNHGASGQHRNSRSCKHLTLTILNQAPAENHRMLRALPLEQSVSVSTLPSVQFTAPFNILVYDYSYLVINSGASPAAAYLQISPDGINWETQSDTKAINPSTLISFVPDVIAKYARLGYRSQPASPNTTLQIYIQGRSYN